MFGQLWSVDSLTSLILQTLDIETAPFYRVVQAEDAEPVVSLEPTRSLLRRNSIASAQTAPWVVDQALRSEEHTSELQSHLNLVCRLLLEKKKMFVQSAPHSRPTL